MDTVLVRMGYSRGYAWKRRKTISFQYLVLLLLLSNIQKIEYTNDIYVYRAYGYRKREWNRIDKSNITSFHSCHLQYLIGCLLSIFPSDNSDFDKILHEFYSQEE